MSPSEDLPQELTAAIRRVGELSGQLVEQGRVSELPADELRRLVSAAVRLYATANEGQDQEVEPTDADVATTDSVVMACALIKSQDLNPFDLALWFSRSRVAG